MKYHKKMKAKLLTGSIAALMIISALPMAVFAEEANPENLKIPDGTAIETQVFHAAKTAAAFRMLKAGERTKVEDKACYSFTPDKDGTYVFTVPGRKNCDVEIYLFAEEPDEDGDNYIARDWTGEYYDLERSYDLKAGHTYYVKTDVFPNDDVVDSAEDVSCFIKLIEKDRLATIHFYTNKQDSYYYFGGSGFGGVKGITAYGEIGDDVYDYLYMLPKSSSGHVLGWTTDPDAKTVETSIPAATETRAYAVWDDAVDVTFRTEEGGLVWGSDTKELKYTYSKGTEINLKTYTADPLRAFDGWYDSNQVSYSGKPVNEDIVLYARWKDKKIVSLSEGEEVNLTEKDFPVAFKFVPSGTGSYRFTFSAFNPELEPLPRINLYDREKTPLESNLYPDFQPFDHLEAGKTYYFTLNREKDPFNGTVIMEKKAAAESKDPGSQPKVTEPTDQQKAEPSSSVKQEKQASKITLARKTVTYNGKPQSIGKAEVTGSKGNVKYAYYVDKACKKQTTKKNSGAAKKGGAPKYSGVYYVKATVKADKNFKGATSKAVKLTVKPQVKDAGYKKIGKSKTYYRCFNIISLKNVKEYTIRLYKGKKLVNTVKSDNMKGGAAKPAVKLQGKQKFQKGQKYSAKITFKMKDGATITVKQKNLKFPK